MSEATPNRPAFNLSAASKAFQGIVNLTLIILTVRDIRQRSDDELKGKRSWWLLAAFAPPFGPIAYLIFGRKRPAEPVESEPVTADLPLDN